MWFFVLVVGFLNIYWIFIGVCCCRGDYVIVIDIDFFKIEYVWYNVVIYGVVDYIEFIVGDFFKIVFNLKVCCV